MEWVKGRGWVAGSLSLDELLLLSLSFPSGMESDQIISILLPSGVRMGSRMMGFVLLSVCDHPQRQLWSREAFHGY